MKTWVRRSLNAGALTAGALLAAGAPAHADTLLSEGNTGILNGTQLLAPIQIPLDVCGNAIGVAGDAAAGCVGGSAASLNPEWTYAHYQTQGNTGILNGTQAIAPIQAPVNVCGNAIGVLGDAAARCQGGATADHHPDCPTGKKKEAWKGKDKDNDCPDDGYGYESGYGKKPDNRKPGRYGPGHRTLVSQGNTGILNGTQAITPIQIPINVCGIAVGILGDAQASCAGGSTARLG